MNELYELAGSLLGYRHLRAIIVTADGPLVTRIASWCGVTARWLKPLMVPIAVTLDDARTTLGDTMKALAEILAASQKMQRELLEAPERLSSPDDPETAGEEEG